MTRYRSKSATTWLGVVGGALGAHGFYLHGRRDGWAWLHVPPTLAGAYGAWRMRTFGQDDALATLLVPLLGLMITVGMVGAIVAALTPDERWDARYNPGQASRATRWVPVLGAIAALLLGGAVLMSTIAFSGQRYFEWSKQRLHAVTPTSASD
jgi:hypothetical protein